MAFSGKDDNVLSNRERELRPYIIQDEMEIMTQINETKLEEEHHHTFIPDSMAKIGNPWSC